MKKLKYTKDLERHVYFTNDGDPVTELMTVEVVKDGYYTYIFSVESQEEVAYLQSQDTEYDMVSTQFYVTLNDSIFGIPNRVPLSFFIEHENYEVHLIEPN